MFITQPYIKCVLRLSCVVHRPIYGRFMSCTLNGFLSVDRQVFFAIQNLIFPMLRNNADVCWCSYFELGLPVVTAHQSVAQNVCDMWRSTIENNAALLGAQFLENRSPTRYCFRAGETTQRIRHRVKVTSLTLILIYDYSIYSPKFLVS